MLILTLLIGGSIVEPPLRELSILLAKNNQQNSIKVGPVEPLANFTGFHNHVAYQLVVMYRFGASAAAMREQAKQATHSMLPPVPSQGLINGSNWADHIGGCGCGLVSGRTDVLYLDYYNYYAAYMAVHGPNATLLAHWPRLAAGLVGDIFHAVIQLGYAFEGRGTGTTDPAHPPSGVHILPGLVAQGLAWSSTAFATLPSPPSGGRLRQAPLAALATLHEDAYPFPPYIWQDEATCFPIGGDPHGNVCWNDAIDDLVVNRSAALIRYELHPSMLPANEDSSFEALCRAALVVFAAGGYKDFYLLHLVTGSRAVWSIAVHSGLRWSDATRRAMLDATWRSVLYGYVARRRPSISPPPPLSPPWRPWHKLQAASLLYPEEPHLAKLVLVCADFHARWADDLYWQTAERAVELYEAGGKFEH